MDANSGKRRDTNGDASEGGKMQRAFLHNTTRPQGSVDGNYQLTVRAPAKPLGYGASTL